jgi:D-alanyl-D-alanine carboxypeptidase
VQQTEEIDTGWTKIDGCQYYLNNDGSLHTGWLELDGARYYFYTDGIMATGCVEIPELGKRYFDATGKEVVLVNPWNYVPEEYSVKLGSYGGYQMAKHIISPLKQMLSDCKAAGHTAIVSSAYRSHQDQIYLHNRRIQRFLDQGYSEEDAKREAARRVAVPGTSEHELGLALDIVDINYQNLTEKQETMPAQQWLIKNSWKYGFILRYPNEKSDVTGIIYEPWHYRYVGEELAAEIHKSGLCLEEYLAQLTK